MSLTRSENICLVVQFPPLIRYLETLAGEVVKRAQKRDHSPHCREKTMEYQTKQDSPILLNTDHPDEDNVYCDLELP